MPNLEVLRTMPEPEPDQKTYLDNDGLVDRRSKVLKQGVAVSLGSTSISTRYGTNKGVSNR